MPDGQADFVVVEVLAVSENSIDVHIYPNPTDGMVNILAQEMSLVRVFNTVGQKILEVKAEDNRCSWQLPLHSQTNAFNKKLMGVG